jgi:oxygen-independent coproporphyrinogen-3 oxidase
LPKEELAAQMYALASSKLRGAGFTHYELSNYAKPGHECRHNRVYWEGKPFFALGMGAASYVGWHRFTRPRSMGEYRLWVALLEDRGWGPATGWEDAKGEWPPQQWAVERLEDLLMVGLRLKEGVSLPQLLARSGLPAAVGEQRAAAVLGEWEAAVVSRFVERGAAGYDGGRLVLTDPEGLLVSNEVISELYAAVARVLEDSEGG